MKGLSLFLAVLMVFMAVQNQCFADDESNKRIYCK